MVSTFNGSIDEVRVYNRALSADEIKRLYRIGAMLHVNTGALGANNSLQNGLVGYWSFNNPDMAGNIAYDRSNSTTTIQNGTLTNGPTRTIGKLGQALSFSQPKTQYVNMGNLTGLNLTGKMSISAWFKTSSSLSEAHIADKSTCSSSVDAATFELLMGGGGNSGALEFGIYDSTQHYQAIDGVTVINNG